jgi:hypothetical protein
MLHQTSPPISRLPTELVAEVFECTIALDKTEFSCQNVQLYDLIRVCRRWHALIMACPSLWSSLVFTSVKATALMLQRSKESPLVVKADFLQMPMSKRPVDQAVWLALSNISRIRILHINGFNSFDERLFSVTMSQHAPLLESLRLASWPSERHVMILLPSLSTHTTPRLRHFSVSNLSVSWNSPLLCNLTHLEIRESTSPPLVALCNVLSRCPLLNTLILRNALPATSDQLQIPVSLPLLSHLQLVGGFAGCDVVMHNISFPRTTAVTLNFDVAPGPPLSHFLTNLRDRVSTIARLRLYIQFASTRVWAWTTESVAIDNPHLDLLFRELHDTSRFHAICEGFALTQLLNLELEIEGLAPNGCMAILGTLQDLQVLTVSRSDVDVVISALRPTPERGVPFPSLRKLALGHGNNQLNTVNLLRACLMLRKENNAGIETLRLFNWSFLCKVDVDMLRESLGSVVEWDGIQRGYITFHCR